MISIKPEKPTKKTPKDKCRWILKIGRKSIHISALEVLKIQEDCEKITGISND